MIACRSCRRHFHTQQCQSASGREKNSRAITVSGCIRVFRVVQGRFQCHNADYQVCSGWRRRRRKDLLTDLLHDQQVPTGVCAHSESVAS